MKQTINKLLQKILQAQKEQNQTLSISEWVMMKYYAPFTLNEEKLIMI